MSVIVAIKENGVIYMGADSQTTAGRRKYISLTEDSHKIVKLKNGMLVGFCGSVGARQTILAMEDIFTLDEEGRLTKKHILRNITPKLVDKMEQIGDERRGSMDVSILLAYKDQLYRISQGLNVLHLNEVGKSGSGADYADYPLWNRRDLPVRERILRSLISSAKRTESVCGPYVLIDTEKQEYEIVDMGGENY